MIIVLIIKITIIADIIFIFSEEVFTAKKFLRTCALEAFVHSVKDVLLGAVHEQLSELEEAYEGKLCEW